MDKVYVVILTDLLTGEEFYVGAYPSWMAAEKRAMEDERSFGWKIVLVNLYPGK